MFGFFYYTEAALTRNGRENSTTSICRTEKSYQVGDTDAVNHLSHLIKRETVRLDWLAEFEVVRNQFRCCVIGAKSCLVRWHPGYNSTSHLPFHYIP